MPTIKQLAAWLEEDGHPGCAGQLLQAAPQHRAAAAMEAAGCAENDPDTYDDDIARALPGELREWAASHRKRTSYRFIARSGAYYVWESVLPLPGDSRYERITCPVRWFWAH